MSSLLTNLPIINNLAQELVRAKVLNYSQECVPYYINDSQFIIDEITDLKTPSGFKLKSTLIKHKQSKTSKKSHSQKTEKSNRVNNTSNVNHKITQTFISSVEADGNSIRINQKCIVFLHGLGSSRLQPLPIIQHLPKEYCLFTFDAAGSGKSEGNNITYGMRQSQDVEFIINYLSEKKGLREFIIWGRSMGAVAGLLFLQKISKDYLQKQLSPRKKEEDDGQEKGQIYKKIKAIVIDSPFSDFREITKQIALKRVKLPEFLIEVTLNIIDENFNELLKGQTGKSYNPFQIKLSTQKIQTTIPAVFLYSEIDEVVPKDHSLKIIKNFKGQYEKISIDDCSHNQTRPKEIISRIFQALKTFQRRSQYNTKVFNDFSRNRQFDSRFDLSIHERRKSRGISVTAQSVDKSPRKSFRDFQNKKDLLESSLMKGKPMSVAKLQSYSSLKIEPKSSKKLKKVAIRPTGIPLPESINCLIDKFKTINYQSDDLEINNFHKTEGETKLVMFNTIQTQNNEFIKRKLNDSLFDKYREESGLNRPIFRGGRRNCKANRKVEYQLNHTRYL